MDAKTDGAGGAGLTPGAAQRGAQRNAYAAGEAKAAAAALAAEKATLQRRLREVGTLRARRACERAPPLPEGPSA